MVKRIRKEHPIDTYLADYQPDPVPLSDVVEGRWRARPTVTDDAGRLTRQGLEAFLAAELPGFKDTLNNGAGFSGYRSGAACLRTAIEKVVRTLEADRAHAASDIDTTGETRVDPIEAAVQQIGGVMARVMEIKRNGSCRVRYTNGGGNENSILISVSNLEDQTLVVGLRIPIRVGDAGAVCISTAEVKAAATSC